ncbi:hypothetical protein KBD49_00085 [Myxococcota bacterium]|nr:hypothetical protein [Myxococcota bacterium]
MSIGRIHGYDLEQVLKADMSLVFRASKGGEPRFLKVYRLRKEDPVNARRMHEAQEALRGPLRDLGNITEDILEHGVIPLSAAAVGDYGAGADLQFQPEAYYQVKPWLKCINVADYLGQVRTRLGTLFRDWGSEAARTETVEHLERMRTLFGMLAAILKRCHDHGIVHQDLKPQQVLLVELPVSGEGFLGKYRLMFADFDAAFLASTGPIHRVTTLRYESFEHVTGGRLGPWSDVFTMGRMIGEALGLGAPLLWTSEEEGSGLTEVDQARYVKRARYCLSFQDYYARQFEPVPVDREGLKRLDGLLARCFQEDPSSRPSAGELARELMGLRLFQTSREPVPPPSPPPPPPPATPPTTGRLREPWFRLRADERQAYTVKAGQTILDRRSAKAQFPDLADDDGNEFYRYLPDAPALEFRLVEGEGWEVRVPPTMPNGFHLRRGGAPEMPLTEAWVPLEVGDELALYSRKQGRVVPHLSLKVSVS